MRILVLTRSYPAPGDLYQYPFVHRRVLAYAAAGHDVTVFRPTADARLSSHEFEGVRCFSGNGDMLREFVGSRSPEVVAAHGFAEEMWEALSRLDELPPTRAWLHGSEIPGFFRRKAMALSSAVESSQALEAVRERCRFWSGFLESRPSRFKLVFVSRSAVQLAREDLDGQLLDDDFSVLPNPIDTTLFRYRTKSSDDRLSILMIRPFDSSTYGNDLAVSAIRHLSRKSGFNRLRFTIIGDGPQFDEVLEPLTGFPNVTIERRFLTQPEIAERHCMHGIFLVPTRLDTQGVSRDEAMASGLVPVTNAVTAVPEFVDSSCAGLAGSEDSIGLADAISEMIDQPELFLSRSARAAERVRAQSGHEIVIPAELGLLAEAAHE